MKRVSKGKDISTIISPSQYGAFLQKRGKRR
nr:MAG TPA: SIGNAL RECOGNITION PARTICLE 9 KDA, RETROTRANSPOSITION, PROTEIN TARGETING, RNA [Caudoviricetes sp.]